MLVINKMGAGNTLCVRVCACVSLINTLLRTSIVEETVMWLTCTCQDAGGHTQTQTHTATRTRARITGQQRGFLELYQATPSARAGSCECDISLAREPSRSVFGGDDQSRRRRECRRRSMRRWRDGRRTDGGRTRCSACNGYERKHKKPPRRGGRHTMRKSTRALDAAILPRPPCTRHQVPRRSTSRL